MGNEKNYEIDYWEGYRTPVIVWTDCGGDCLSYCECFRCRREVSIRVPYKQLEIWHDGLQKFLCPQCLNELRSMNYYDYLFTDVWRDTRHLALYYVSYKCQECGIDYSNNLSQLHVHHKTYERIGNELLSDLVVLCRECHKKIHDDGMQTDKNPIMFIAKETKPSIHKFISIGEVMDNVEKEINQWITSNELEVDNDNN